MSRRFRIIVFHTAVCLPLLTSPTFAADAPAPSRQPNAMFNNTSKSGTIYSIWIREGRGSCEEQREKDHTPLCLSVVPRGPGKYERKDLKYCFRVAANGGLDRCKTGVLNVSEWDLSGRLTGDYDFTLQSGTHLRGDLDGILCSRTNARPNGPPREPE